MKKVFLILTLTIFIASLAMAQTAPRTNKARQPNQSKDVKASEDEGDTITFDSALVNTNVAVRDEKGRFVTGLTKDDFIVLDDGKEQPISYFSEESTQPLTIAFVVDRSLSVKSALSQAQGDARKFFGSVVRAGKDRALLVAFDSGVYVIQDFTDDVSALTTAATRLTTAGGTSVFDAVYKTTRDKLAGGERLALPKQPAEQPVHEVVKSRPKPLPLDQIQANPAMKAEPLNTAATADAGPPYATTDGVSGGGGTEGREEKGHGAAAGSGNKEAGVGESVDYNGVFSIGSVTVRPQILGRPTPGYTDEARRNQIEGSVKISVLLKADGTVSDVKVAHGLGYGLDEKAVEAAHQLRFVPGQKDGHPVSVRIFLEFRFSLI